jgi:hypothetical protein
VVSSIRANPWGALDPPWLRLFLALLLKQPHHSLPFRLSPVALMGIDGADPTALSPSTNCPVLVELRPRLRCPACIIGRVKREPGWVSSECFSLRRFVSEIPQDAWAAPATVSRCGRVNNAISYIWQSHCGFSNSWEGDTSSPASPDTGLECFWKYRVGRCLIDILSITSGFIGSPGLSAP